MLARGEHPRHLPEMQFICQLSFPSFGCLPRSLRSSCEPHRRPLSEIGWLSPLVLACWPRPFRNPLWRDPRASLWRLPGQHRHPFLHRFLEHFCLPTNEALPALESDPIRFDESFDVFPFTVHKRREVDARKLELAHKFVEVKNRRLASYARF